ncbi:MAG: hypothetical protein HRU41_01135 [Saprospiraceae bacterium]|nr:hypothetical protein [Saprospiraceae bacterium]
MSIRTLSITWNNRVIEITYNNDWSKAHREAYGHSMAHLEIKSQDDQPLPISETGYRSHFTPTYVIEKHRGVEEFVRDWLN